MRDSTIILKNNDTERCPLKDCKLKAEDCTADYAGKVLTIKETDPFPVTADRGVKEGYTEKACIVC